MARIVSLVVLMSVLVTNSVTAAEKVLSHKLDIQTSVYSVISPTKEDRDFRVLSITDGRVYKIDADHTGVAATLNLAAQAHLDVTLKLNPSNPDFITSADFLNATRADAMALLLRNSNKSELSDEREALSRDSFSPTVLDSQRDAKRLFSSVYSYAHGYNVDDQCYARAHYWARNFYTQDNVSAQKLFIFFTPKYQREHDYKWWFHVAPMVYVESKSAEGETVLDPTFLNGPKDTISWSKEFTPGAKECANAKVLADYDSRGEKEDCLLIRASMYHFTPNNLRSNPSVNEWRCSDLKRVADELPAPDKKKSWNDVKDFMPEDCK